MKRKSSKKVPIIIGSIVAGLLINGLIVFGLLQYIGSNQEVDKADLEKGITTNVAGLNGAYVGSDWCSGAVCRNKTINLYVNVTDTDEQVQIMDDTLRYVWTHVRYEPGTISVSLTVGKKPDDPQRYEVNALDPRDIAAVLDPSGEFSNVIHERIFFDPRYMVDRYGAFVSIK